MLNKKKFAALIAALGVCASCTGSFAAETSGTPYPPAVSANTLHELGLMNGRGDGLEIDQPVTRAEAVVLLSRVVGVNAADAETEEFPDVDAETLGWAYLAVMSFRSEGIIQGDPDGNFSPYREVTGTEFMNMCCRIAGFEEYEDDPSAVFSIDSVINLAEPLTRGEAAELCVMLLTSETSTGQMGYERLTAHGYDSKKLRKALLYRLPELSESLLADDLNGYMPADENYMFSPMSLKMLTAIAANGASGETRQQLLDAMYISDLDAYNTEAAADIEKLNSAASVELEVANSVWLNTDRTQSSFGDGFLNTAQSIYDAELGTVTNDNAINTINGWASEKTRGKIPTIINNNEFKFALLNAMYFKGNWADEFDPADTVKETFTDKNGEEHEIDFMHKTDTVLYSGDNGMQIVRLPYVPDETNATNIGMYVMKNTDGTVIEDPAGALEGAVMSNARIELGLPKFEIENEFDMKEILSDMGVTKAFEDDAEFSDMLDDTGIYIDYMRQKTYINVDETGTEAAVVTGAAGGTTSVPPEPVTVRFDTPFTYIIKDDISGRILFMGTYAFADSSEQ